MNAKYRHSRSRGFLGVLLVLLLAVGTVFVLYFFGGKKKSYVRTLVDSKQTAADTVQTVNLTGVYHVLLQYAAVHDGKFPASAEELMREGGLAREFFVGTGSKQPGFDYIAGQNERMPRSNLLLYQTSAGRDGKSKVLRLGGKIEMLLPAAVRGAVEQTRKNLK